MSLLWAEGGEEVKSSYVLFSDGLNFHVYEKNGTKESYTYLIHFQGFYPTKKAAFKEAIKRTDYLIKTLKKYQNRFKREAIK